MYVYNCYVEKLIKCYNVERTVSANLYMSIKYKFNNG